MKEQSKIWTLSIWNFSMKCNKFLCIRYICCGLRYISCTVIKTEVLPDWNRGSCILLQKSESNAGTRETRVSGVGKPQLVCTLGKRKVTACQTGDHEKNLFIIIKAFYNLRTQQCSFTSPLVLFWLWTSISFCWVLKMILHCLILLWEWNPM